MGIIGKELEKLRKKNIVRAAMPGNKGNYSVDGKLDFTEIGSLDNLANPKGIIGESQDLTAKLYGVESCHYLTNGSTCGNLALIFSFFSEGDRLLISANSHKSVLNACALRKVEVITLPEVSYKGINMPSDADDILRMAKEHEVSGVILTNPVYNGTYRDYSELHAHLKERNIPLIFDAAHGAHLKKIAKFNFFRSFDACVVSTHKTMNALNQSAMILNNQKDYDEKIKKYINIFQTSSPSYLILKSIEDAVEDMDLFKLTESIGEIREFDAFLKLVDGKTEDRGKLSGDIYGDPWKISLLSQGKGQEIYRRLEENGIYAEYYDLNSSLIMLSPYNTVDEIRRLKTALEEIKVEDILITEFEKNELIKSEKYNGLLYTSDENKEVLSVKIENSEGLISAADIIIYPPGTVAIKENQLIEKKDIAFILENQRIKKDIIGMSDGYIKVTEVRK